MQEAPGPIVSCPSCDGTGWRTYNRVEQGRNYEFAAECECRWLRERPSVMPHTPSLPAPPVIILRRPDLCGACAKALEAGDTVAWPRVPEGQRRRPVYHQRCWREVG